MGIIRKVVVGAAVGAAVEWLAKKKNAGSSAAYSDTGDPENFANVRNAGPPEMQDNPGRWGKVDAESDASFPASDPPANY